MLGHNFSWETWCRQIECLERRDLAYLKKFSKRKKTPCTYILLFISEFKIKTLQSSKIWARFSFWSTWGENTCVYLSSMHVWIHMYTYTQCVMTWFSENQDETLLHEGKGGTLWFWEKTTCKTKLFTLLKHYWKKLRHHGGKDSAGIYEVPNYMACWKLGLVNLSS